MSEQETSTAPRKRGRPPRLTPSEQAHQRLDQDIVDWYCTESVRTGVPVATLQKMVLTQFARGRIRETEAAAHAAPSGQARESRFARSRYLDG